MCGRYTVSNPGEILPELLGGRGEVPEITARYNVAPTQEAPVVVAGEDGSRRVVLMRWGLVPYWAESPQGGARMINARAETAAEKPAFRNSFKRRRCLVAADGFFEWQKVAGGKQPYLIRLEGGAPLAFAGLWDRWRGQQGPALETFTILTTPANMLVRPIHDRMPAILRGAGRDRWLDGETETSVLEELLAPYPAPGMEAFAVSDLVNSPANDSLECLRPVAVSRQGSLF